MPTFLTVKEAAERTGKSPSSIRRALYPIIHDDHHADRAHVEPSPEESLRLRLQGENFAWRLSEEFVQRVFPLGMESKEPSPSSSGSSDTGNAELLAMLRRELDIKNDQIVKQAALLDKQMELISGLSERLREGNILMGSLQQRYTLIDGRDDKIAEVAKPKTAAPAKAEKGSATPKPTKPKPGLFSRMFRR